jgi:GNAT superfamily N-acetyltransferase
MRTGDTFLHTTPLDPLARPLLVDLEREYDERYRELFSGGAAAEMNRYPAEIFSPPHGTFLLLLRAGEPISAGALMTVDEHTDEIKRIWTHPDHRGQGLAKLVLAELEAEAAKRGFADVVLSTGPRQPEAVGLYLATGYEPQFDPTLDPLVIGEHAFRKHLPAAG